MKPVRIILSMASVGLAALLDAGCLPALVTWRLAMLGPVASSPPVYRDDRIEVVFVGTVIPGMTKQLEFELWNLSGGTARILWDQAAFISADGAASRVLHAGVRFIEAGQALPPTTIPPGARVREVAAPADRVRWIGSAWYQEPIVGAKDSGKTVGLLLPIEFADGVHKEYHFQFRVEG